MKRIIIKKDLILKEFVDDTGALGSSKIPTASNNEIESEITTNDMRGKTRQGQINNGGPGGRYGASFGSLAEDGVNSSVMNAYDKLKQAIETSELEVQQIKGLLEQLFKEIINGQ